jgi:uncharacterized RDD family membrane protein YckC
MAYAGFWRRFAALLIDGIILWVVMLAAALVMTNMGWEFTPKSNMIVDDQGIYRRVEGGDYLALLKFELIGLVINWLYASIMLSSPMQATVGKIVMSIYVTDLRGKRIGFGRATVRFIASIVSSLLLLLGYLIMPFTARKQTLHDMVAGTLVVHEFAPRADIR